MKIVEVLNSVEVVKKMTSSDFSIAVAVKLSKVVDELEGILKIYEEKRTALAEGNVNDKGEINDDFKEEFIKGVESLLNETIEVEIDKISIDDLDSVKLTPHEVKLVMFLIDA